MKIPSEPLTKNTSAVHSPPAPSLESHPDCPFFWARSGVAMEGAPRAALSHVCLVHEASLRAYTSHAFQGALGAYTTKSLHRSWIAPLCQRCRMSNCQSWCNDSWQKPVALLDWFKNRIIDGWAVEAWRGDPHESLHASLALDLNASHSLPLVHMPQVFPTGFWNVDLTCGRVPREFNIFMRDGKIIILTSLVLKWRYEWHALKVYELCIKSVWTQSRGLQGRATPGFEVDSILEAVFIVSPNMLNFGNLVPTRPLHRIR